MTNGEPGLAPPVADHDPAWLSVLEQQAWRAALILRGPLMAELGRRLAHHSGLSIADYDVLVALSEVESGTMPVSELLAATDWEASRMSHQLTRMQKRGLLRRRTSRLDGRRSEVSLTPEGARSIRAAAPMHVKDVRELLIDRLEIRHLEALAAITAIVEGQGIRTGGGTDSGE
ncbi:MarR family winged helix-turn-helix transcriptional regulator [Nakamurella sp. A5-74]|uniref:MarR family winged helix-turn-helix transcriptional regulator n=1 Tax=Nakamurella sp. A5-74 TaxID=3158264 RepID=A0AAU8DJ93_9ACTN